MQIIVDIPDKYITSDTCFKEWIKNAGDEFDMFILPKKHGRLIDADAAKCSSCGKFGCENSDLCELFNAKTIIKADGGAE